MQNLQSRCRQCARRAATIARSRPAPPRPTVHKSTCTKNDEKGLRIRGKWRECTEGARRRRRSRPRRSTPPHLRRRRPAAQRSVNPPPNALTGVRLIETPHNAIRRRCAHQRKRYDRSAFCAKCSQTPIQKKKRKKQDSRELLSYDDVSTLKTTRQQRCRRWLRS